MAAYRLAPVRVDEKEEEELEEYRLEELLPPISRDIIEKDSRILYESYSKESKRIA